MSEPAKLKPGQRVIAFSLSKYRRCVVLEVIEDKVVCGRLRQLEASPG